jgi:hypothetical protein
LSQEVTVASQRRNPIDTGAVRTARRIGARLLSRAALSLEAATMAVLTTPAPLAAQVMEWRIEQDPFAAIDRLAAEPYTREQLQNVSVDGDILDLVRLLDADDYAVREQATTELLKQDNRRIQLYAVLALGTLSVEQRCRVLQVVREQLVNAPRGALGIQMDPPMFIPGGPIEIRIADLIAGLPAERVLQVGDRIVALDGNPLFTHDDLQSRIQAKKPGDPINVTVKRPKVDDAGRLVRNEAGDMIAETLTFEMQLGPAELLDQRNRQQGLNIRGNRIDQARRVEADAITYAYAPRPRPLTVTSGAALLSREDDDVERAGEIINLRMQQEMLADVGPAQLRAMQDMWRQQLAALLERAQRPGLTDAERDYLQRVADRFVQIMNAGS